MKEEKFKTDQKSHVNVAKQEKNLRYFFWKDMIAAGKNTLSQKQDKLLSIFIACCAILLIVLFTIAFILNSQNPLISFVLSNARKILLFI